MKNGRRARKIAAMSLALLTAAGVGGIATSALFTDTKTVGSNTFNTGSVILNTSPTTALFTVAALAPGDTIVKPLTVSNAGTLALRYAMLSTTTEDTLASALQMTIKVGVTTCDAANFAATGTAVSGPTALGSTTGLKVIGDAATGTQAGDRTLAGAANEVLCIKVTLPSTAGNSSQNLSTTAAFRFDAEQTTNNP